MKTKQKSQTRAPAALQNKLRGKVSYRAAHFDRAAVDTEARTVALAFSSEEPYERWWGVEILDHGKGSVDLDWLNDGAPLLVNHDIDNHVGVIESASIDPSDKRGRAVVRFGRSGYAEEVWQDVQDGIRKGVSVGYGFNPDDMVLEEKGEKDRPPVYRVMQWQPVEITLASIPADTTVGVGRSNETQDDNHPHMEVRTMAENTSDQATLDAETAAKAAGSAKQSGHDRWQERAKEVAAFKELYPELKEFERFLDPDRPMSELHGEVAKVLDERAKTAVKSDGSDAEIGLTNKEVKQYSMVKLIRHLANLQDHGAAKAAGFELECSSVVADAKDKAPQGAWMPDDIANRGMVRTQQVGDFTTGGALVDEGPQGIAFIELLRASMMTVRAGVQEINGLVGDVDVPKQTAGQTAYWVGEDEDITQSDATVGSIKLTPKTIGCFNKITRRLIKQSSISIENMIRADAAATIGTAIDLAGLHGTGASQPTGIAATPGIGSVAMGTNGLAITYAKLVDLEAEPSTNNAAVGNMAFMTNTYVRREARQILQNASATDAGWIWKTGQFAEVGDLLGYPAYTTNQVSSTLTKGTSTSVCSAVFFANWADAIYGFWSGLDINVDTSAYSSSGGLKLVFLKDVDFAVRRAASFAAILDVLTA